MAKNRQLKISVEPELADRFKLACTTDGVSMASEITKFMERRAGEKYAGPDRVRLTTRRHRRKAVREVISLLNKTAQAEEAYRDNIPENLQGSAAYESADAALSNIEDAVSVLEGVFE
jgi:hypothetical protein